MIPVRPRTSFLDREEVIEITSWLDHLQGTAIECVRNVQSVPVNRCRFRQSVSEVNDYPVALINFERRAGNSPVVRVANRCLSWNKRQPCRLSGNSHLDRVGRTRLVDQNGWTGRAIYGDNVRGWLSVRVLLCS